MHKIVFEEYLKYRDQGITAISPSYWGTFDFDKSTIDSRNFNFEDIFGKEHIWQTYNYDQTLSNICGLDDIFNEYLIKAKALLEQEGVKNGSYTLAIWRGIRVNMALLPLTVALRQNEELKDDK